MRPRTLLALPGPITARRTARSGFPTSPPTRRLNASRSRISSVPTDQTVGDSIPCGRSRGIPHGFNMSQQTVDGRASAQERGAEIVTTFHKRVQIGGVERIRHEPVCAGEDSSKDIAAQRNPIHIRLGGQAVHSPPSPRKLQEWIPSDQIEISRISLHD